MSSASSDSILERGVISSSAVRSPNCSERSTSAAVVWSSEPCRAEVRTSDTSSCGERAERSSSAGSMPNRLSIRLAVPLVRWISGVNSVENITCGPATTRAVRSGTATARYWATSSPNTIDTEVAISRARIRALTSIQRSGRPTAARTGAHQPRDQGFGEVTGDQRGDRDADLGAGELEGQRPVGALDHLVAAGAAAGVGVDGAALERGQRELGGHEDRGAEGQEDESEQAEQDGDDAHRVLTDGPPGLAPG